MYRTRLALMASAATVLLLSENTFAQQPLPAEGNEAELLQVLRSDAELFEKAKACQRLAVIGTSKSVPVLARLLGDENLSHYARFGLESNPSADVDGAFRNALGELSGKPLIGVINSVGVRRDMQAVDALIEAAEDSHADVASAALAALGAIATPEAIAAIQEALDGEPAQRVVAADACLTAADILLTGGENNGAAANIFAAVRAAELPKHLNVASRFGEIRSGSGDVNGLMNQYLTDQDNDLFRIGLELAHDVTGPETTQQLLTHLESAPPTRQVLLLHVLGDRGDPSALPAVLTAVRSDNDDIRLAATRVLGTLGDRSVLPILLQAAVSGDASLEETARDSLAELPGAGVDDELSKRLAESDGRERVVLAEVAGRRGISSAIPMLLTYAAADDAELRNTAIDALGMTVGLQDVPPLLDRLIAAQSSETADSIREALRKACQRMPNRDAAAGVLLERMSGASAGAVAEITDLLIYVGGESALAGLQTAANGSNDAAIDAATQALGKWLTPDVAPVLLALAQTGHENYRVRCLRGYIRVIRQFGLRPNERLQMSRQAFDAATRDVERNLVLDTLTRFPSAAGLKMITPHLDNPALQAEASKAAVTICEKIVNTDRKAVAAIMPQVVAVISDPELANRAKVLVTRANAD